MPHERPPIQSPACRARLARMAGDMAAEAQRMAHTIARLGDEAGMSHANLRLIAEIVGRYCDVTERLHDLARDLEAEAKQPNA